MRQRTDSAEFSDAVIGNGEYGPRVEIDPMAVTILAVPDSADGPGATAEAGA